MSENPPLTFSNITPHQFSTLTTKARAAGIELNGNSGSASKFGVEVAWNYVPATQQLTLHCLRTPFFMKLADVNAQMRALVESTTA